MEKLPPRVIFYDGLCGLCDGCVTWILGRDTRRRFHFAALQGETAKALRSRNPESFPAQPNSLIYLDSSGPEPLVFQRSRAVFQILAELGGPYRIISRLRVLPRVITDLPYSFIARMRYRLYGRLDACRLPDDQSRSRFLS
jgi:predicted DCC family thiol-disulfide oxidoreductase YuxK